MGSFIVYIIKSAFCLTLFYLFYRLLLSRETLHRLNRGVLLGSIVGSFLLPMLVFTTHSPALLNPVLFDADAVEEVITSDAVAGEATSPMRTVIIAAILIYFVGVVVLLVREAVAVIGILRLRHKGEERRKLDDGCELIVLEGDSKPFSWMRSIFVSRRDMGEGLDAILTHEQAHIRYRHSLDMLLADLSIALQWFNPAAWLMKGELMNVHEFEADDAVLSRGFDACQYQLLLIKKAVGSSRYSIANSFNHKSLKLRIAMMLKEKSSKWAQVKYLAILPLAALTVAAFARPELSNSMEKIADIKVSEITANIAASSVNNPAEQQQEDEPMKACEVLPEFPGGTQALMQYLMENMRYPKLAQEVGAGGRVIVSFVVESDGSLSDFTIRKHAVADDAEFAAPAKDGKEGVKVSGKELNQAFDEEAVRVLKTSPKWTPGQQGGKPVRVMYTLPLSFKCQ